MAYAGLPLRPECAFRALVPAPIRKTPAAQPGPGLRDFCARPYKGANLVPENLSAFPLEPGRIVRINMVRPVGLKFAPPPRFSA